jgi:hypothetical protein
MPERILAAVAGVLLCLPAAWADLSGIGLISVVLFLHFAWHRGSSNGD